MAAMEQVRLKRAGLGLRGWDAEQAFPGYTLFAPLTGRGEVYLVDMTGEVVHRWCLPHPPGLYG